MPYHEDEHALVPDPVVDEAVRLHDKKVKRAEALAAAGKGKGPSQFPRGNSSRAVPKTKAQCASCSLKSALSRVPFYSSEIGLAAL